MTEYDRDNLLELGDARRGRPKAGADVANLVKLGLVAFSHETVTGRTYYKLTRAGRIAAKVVRIERAGQP